MNMAKGKRKKEKGFRVSRPVSVSHSLFAFCLLSFALLVALLPIYWMLTISLKTEVDQFAVDRKSVV